MGFGGSVQAMIDSLKTNARRRPSSRHFFHRQAQRSKFQIEKREAEKMSPTQQQWLRERLLLHKSEKRKRQVKQAIFTIVATVLLALLAIYVVDVLKESPEYFFHGNPQSHF